MLTNSFVYLCPNCAEFHSFTYQLHKMGIDELSIKGPEKCRHCNLTFDPTVIADKINERLMKDYYAN